jgi:hypothetical protein
MRGPLHLSNLGLAFYVLGMRKPALLWKLLSPAPSAILCGKFGGGRGHSYCMGVGMQKGGWLRGGGPISRKASGLRLRAARHGSGARAVSLDLVTDGYENTVRWAEWEELRPRSAYWPQHFP